MTSKSQADPAVNTTAEEALRLAKLGYYVVRVYPIENDICSCEAGKNCRNPGKHPIGGDKRASNNPETVAGWWRERPNANVGINLSLSGLVDVSSDSSQALRDFRQRGLPETAVWQSGSGPDHQHHLYRRPDDCPLVRQCQSGAFDLMSLGIAVVPPSVSGKGRYLYLEPISTGPSQLPESPSWVSRELRQQQEKERQINVDPDEPPVRLTGAALERWHGRMFREDASGVDESGSLVDIANDLARVGLSARGIFLLLQERAQALRYLKYESRDDREIRYAEIAASAVERFSPSAKPAGFEILPFSAAKNRPKPEWLIEGILVQRNLSVLYGPSGIGKTFIALEMTMCVQLGRPFLGRKTNPGPVVYIACEDGDGVALRISGWQNYYKVPDEELDRRGGGLILSSANLRDPGESAALLVALEALPEPPKLVVIDTLAWAMVGGDENKVQDIMAIIDAAKRLQDALDCTVLIVHHTGKDGETERGSSALRGAAASMIKVSGESGSDRAAIELDKLRGAAPPKEPIGVRMIEVPVDDEDPTEEKPADMFSLVLSTTCVVVPDDQPASISNEDKSLTPSAVRLLREISQVFEVGEPASFGRLKALATGTPEKSVARALKLLLDKNYLERESERKPYKLTELGLRVAQSGEDASLTAVDRPNPDRPVTGFEMNFS